MASAIESAITSIVKQLFGKDINYSKVYLMQTIVLNPVTQALTGISISGEFSQVFECKIYSIGLKFLMVPPGTPFLMGFINADPTQPYVAGFDMSFPGISHKTTISPGTEGTPLPAGGSAIFINT